MKENHKADRRRKAVRPPGHAAAFRQAMQEEETAGPLPVVLVCVACREACDDVTEALAIIDGNAKRVVFTCCPACCERGQADPVFNAAVGELVLAMLDSPH